MKIESKGFRRLYDAIHCSINGADEMAHEFEFGNFYVQLYFGPEPRYGIDLTQYDNFGVPGETFNIPIRQFKRASESDYPRKFFTEITCWRKATATSPVHPSLGLEKESEFRSAADMIAGAVGLRFHYQLVKRLVCENTVTLKGAQGRIGQDGFDLLQQASFDIVQKVTINELDLRSRISSEAGAVQSSEAKHNLLALTWILRAWNEKDKIYRFLSLFIPIEVLLQGSKAVPPSDDKANQLYQLVEQYAGKEKDILTKYLKDLHRSQKSPSLVSRFEAMATQANISGWEKDVEAFRRFNQMRNALVHRGEATIQFQTTVEVIDKDTKVVQDLQDLAERYLNWALYKDNRLYNVSPNSVGWHESRVKAQTKIDDTAVKAPTNTNLEV